MCYRNHVYSVINHIILACNVVCVVSFDAGGDTVKRELDKRENIRVVTSNELIVANGLEKLSLNARKILYLAIAQCRKNDKEFYTYSVSPKDLSEMFGIDISGIYHEADSVTDELMGLFLKITKGEKKSFKKKHVFENCEYDEEHMISFELHKDMGELLLGLTGNFSQPALWDFVKMRSKYSISVWHLMQREMHSRLPSVTTPTEFELSLQELREVTNTTNKFERISQFKDRVLNTAIKEIRENLLADIVYDDKKHGHTIVGFRFTAVSCLGIVDKESLTLRDRQRIRKAQLIRKKAEGGISKQEQMELDYINNELYQMQLEDIYK